MGTVTTDHKARPLVSWEDLPKKAQADFDYLGDDDKMQTRFVKYRGTWYDAADSQRINDHGAFGFHVLPDNPLHGWDSIATDSFFSGTVFRFPTDKEVHDRDLYSERYDVVIVGRWSE